MSYTQIDKTIQYPLVNSAKGDFCVNGRNFKQAFQVIAGPCAVESREQIFATATAVKEAGATMLRGGAFKPRTSPYDFQGLKAEGLKLLVEAGKAVGLPVVSEVMSVRDLELFDGVDVIQIGARDMQNYDLLKEAGRFGKPVMIKRSFAATVEEWLLCAEYVMKEGNDKVILCERGIRSYASVGKGIIDFESVLAVKRQTGLPVIVDPSHSSFDSCGVKTLALCAAVSGADGVMIETHVCPEKALCDADHQITPDRLKDTVLSINGILKAIKQ